MAILKRYVCKKHGEFDAWAEGVVRCPAAKCRCKPGELVSAPAVRTGTPRTANIDRTLNQLASDFGMSNIRSTREGDHQTGYLTRNNSAPPQRQSGVMWGSHNLWGYNVGQVVKSGRPAPILDEQVGFAPSDLKTNQPRPIPYLRDPDNLKLK